MRIPTVETLQEQKTAVINVMKKWKCGISICWVKSLFNSLGQNHYSGVKQKWLVGNQKLPGNYEVLVNNNSNQYI